MNLLSEVNIVAALAATVANTVGGMIWYSPAVFGKPWMKATGMTDAKAKSGMQKAMVLGLSATLIMSIFLQPYLSITGASTLREAIHYGVVLILAMAVPLELSAIAWEQRPGVLFWINVGWDVVAVLMTVAILYSWPW